MYFSARGRVDDPGHTNQSAIQFGLVMNGRKRFTVFLVIVIVTFALGAVAFTAVDISNETEPSRAETWLASFLFRMKALSRRPPTLAREFTANVEDLERASSMYQQMCAFCHGATRGRMAPFAKSLSPRPPQFVIEPSHGPTWRDTYVIQHGIRWTGMPAFQGLAESEAWHLALYVEGQSRPRE